MPPPLTPWHLPLQWHHPDHLACSFLPCTQLPAHSLLKSLAATSKIHRAPKPMPKSSFSRGCIPDRCSPCAFPRRGCLSLPCPGTQACGWDWGLTFYPFHVISAWTPHLQPALKMLVPGSLAGDPLCLLAVMIIFPKSSSVRLKSLESGLDLFILMHTGCSSKNSD